MDVHTAIRQRRSCRAYAQRPVDRDQVEAVLDAARLAPSACNRQPWRFAVVTDAALRLAIVNRGFRGGLGMQWAADAPVQIILGMQREIVRHRLAVLFSRVDYPWLDLGIAGEHLVLRATEMGLATCWIGWINPKVLRRLVGWPLSVRPVAVITLGHPAEAAPAERPRKPISRLACWR
jgi:nitroreductase